MIKLKEFIKKYKQQIVAASVIVALGLGIGIVNHIGMTEDEYEYVKKNIIVSSDSDNFESYGGKVTKLSDNLYSVTYKTVEAAQNAKNLMGQENDIVFSSDSVIEMQSLEESEDAGADVEDTKSNIDNVEYHSELSEYIMSHNTDTESVTVAILDTGHINDTVNEDGTYKYHERVIDKGYNFSNSGEKDSIVDDNGHGSQMSQIILENTSDNVKILPIKILDNNGKGSVSALCQGLRTAIDNKVDIINLSIATASKDCDVLNALIDEAYSKGIIVVGSAGNQNTNTKNIFPANNKNVITIASLKTDLTISDFSNYGSEIDYSVIGEGIELFNPVTIEVDKIEGTSVAAAKATAIISKLKAANKEYTTDDIIKILDEYSLKFNEMESKYYGRGIVEEGTLSINGSDKEIKDSISSKIDINGVDNWKELSDEELDILFANSTTYSCAVFLQNCTEDERERLHKLPFLSGSFWTATTTIGNEDDEDKDEERTDYEHLYDFLESMELNDINAQYYGGNATGTIIYPRLNTFDQYGNWTGTVREGDSKYIYMYVQEQCQQEWSATGHYGDSLYIWGGDSSAYLNISKQQADWGATHDYVWEQLDGVAINGYTIGWTHSARHAEWYSFGGSTCWVGRGLAYSGDYSWYNTMEAEFVLNGNSYTVSYNSNGGSGTMAASGTNFGRPFRTSKCTFTRENYTFVGWNEKADGTGTAWNSGTAGTYENGKYWTYGYTKNITLYAQWKINSGTIYYNPNGGTTSKTLKSDGYFNETTVVKLNAISVNLYDIKTLALTKSGYYVKSNQEWNTANDGSGTSYGQNDGSIASNVISKLKASGYGGYLKLNLYANWYYNVTYNVNGGVIIGSKDLSYKQSIHSRKNATALDVNIKGSALRFERPGYTLKGWATSSTGKVVYKPGATISEGKGNKTLYAVWEKTGSNKYIRGGTSNEVTVSYADYQTEVEQSNAIVTPKKDGYEFCGYYDSVSNNNSDNAVGKGQVVDATGKIIGDASTYTKDKTVHAMWKETVQYSLSYDLNGGEKESDFSTVTDKKNTTVTITENIPVRNGYTFIGWKYLNDNSTYQAGDSIKLDCSKVLVAQWELSTADVNIQYWMQKPNGIKTIHDSDNYEKYGDIQNVTVNVSTDTITDTTKTLDNKTLNTIFVNYAKTIEYVDSTGVVSDLPIKVIDAQTKGINVYLPRKTNTVTVTRDTDSINSVNGKSQEVTIVETYPIGATVNLIAAKNLGYINATWSVTKDTSKTLTGTTGDNYQFTMPNNPVEINVAATLGSYTLTVNPNGGTWNGFTTSQKYKLSYNQTKTISTPEKTGYIFDGWKNTSPETLKDGIFTMYDRDVTLTAQYLPRDDIRYVVNYYYQNSALNTDKNTYILSMSEDRFGTADSTITIKSPRMDGFKTPADVKIKIQADGSTVVNIYYDRYYATVKYCLNRQTATASGVSLDGEPVLYNGKYYKLDKNYMLLSATSINGTYDYVTTKVPYTKLESGTLKERVNHRLINPANINPVKRGYTYVDTEPWYNEDTDIYTDAEGSSISADRFNELTKTSNAELTLYMNWMAGYYDITLDQNQATTETNHHIYLHYEDAYYSDGDCTKEITKVTPPLRYGYIFDGFYDYSDSKNPTQIIDADGNIVVGNDYFADDSTIIAKWTPRKTKITFDGNKPSTALDDVDVKNVPKSVTNIFDANSNVSVSPVPSLDGWDFDGWYSEKEGGAKVYDNKGKASEGFWIGNLWHQVDETMTLYAHWTAKAPIISVKGYSGDNTVLGEATTTKEASIEWTNDVTTKLEIQSTGVGISKAKITATNGEKKSTGVDETPGKVSKTTVTSKMFEGAVSYIGTATNDDDTSSTTKTLLVKYDKTPVVINDFDVKLGSLSQNGNGTTGTLISGQEMYNSDGTINSLAFGAMVSFNLSDQNAKAFGGTNDVSGIKIVNLVVTDPESGKTKTYTVVDNGNKTTLSTISNYMNYGYGNNNIVNVNTDFSKSTILNYQLVVTDNAGNVTKSEIKSTNCGISLTASIERVTNNSSTDVLDAKSFYGGYRGVIHIETTGWTDTITLSWPDLIEKGKQYDKSKGQPIMDYNVTIDMNPVTNPKVVSKDDTGTGFTRCYDFEFWIPIYVMEANGYSSEDIIDVPINLLAKRNSTESGVTKEVTVDVDVLLTLNGGNLTKDYRSSIIDP